MGANQSYPGSQGGDQPHNPSEVKTCYYELLGVDRQASDEEYVQCRYRHAGINLGL